MNTFLPHDLLWTENFDWLPADAPLWAVDALRKGHPVVVRRASGAVDQVAVGVRAGLREQRYATWMPMAVVQRRVRPEQLCDLPAMAQDWPALQALRALKPVLDATGLTWGVSGSAGFELATGCSALHQHSDLDLILRTAQPFDRQAAAQLLQHLHTPLCRIDVQLQTPHGGVALLEWAGAARQVLLKSSDGARLVSNPWQALEPVA
ncbi:malonate decarboxylase holo-ACP synthase [Pseudomonas sp. R5(2019)]|uniref:malonate decarboxylase holo-ACP synthase n=1 Tax=Pseudomonas sp. R5(2019) TaxID=2697566 RepID=UPI0014129062|nr:malonate decarboxylase holo-ACP synthase [Pseudomonas sp. R5(2019)]NBA98456.1 malonate decarboxylase holo-ACP synthase [Pseudomonas sp. R5(2019)]